MLKKAQTSQEVTFLEKDIQEVAKSLKINSMEDESSPTSQPPIRKVFLILLLFIYLFIYI